MKGDIKMEINTTPEVGDGATICYRSDTHAATIIAVSKSGKRVTVQRDVATRTDSNGMSESQSYEYTPNIDGEVETFSLRKNGRWVKKGEAVNGTGLMFGVRREYFDYSW